MPETTSITDVAEACMERWSGAKGPRLGVILRLLERCVAADFVIFQA